METVPRSTDPSLAALVGRLMASGTLEWRHHGIGLLQAYVVQGPVEYRLHVWHPDLRFVDEDSGMIHDHRFELESRVLLGAIYDTEVVTHRADKGWVIPRPVYQVWEVENARKAAMSGEGWVRKVGENEPGVLSFLDGSPLCTIATYEHVYSQGARYTYPARKFHRSETKELTVTLVKKTGQDERPARILARVGATPKHGIGAPMMRVVARDDDVVDDPRERFIWEAADRLLELARRS